MFVDRIFIYFIFLIICKDGFMRFWNPESGKQITSKMIDVLKESTKEEDQKVMIICELPIVSSFHLNKE